MSEEEVREETLREVLDIIDKYSNSERAVRYIRAAVIEMMEGE